MSDALSDDLTGLRQRIERIDAALVGLVAERQALARKVGEHKRAQGLPVIDPAREAAVIARAGSLAREAGLPDEEVRAMFRRLVALSRRAQATNA